MHRKQRLVVEALISLHHLCLHGQSDVVPLALRSRRVLFMCSGFFFIHSNAAKVQLLMRLPPNPGQHPQVLILPLIFCQQAHFFREKLAPQAQKTSHVDNFCAKFTLFFKVL